MSFWGNLFGSNKKVNSTIPETVYPKQENLYMTPSLRQLAKQRVQAGTTGEETPGVGYGADFLDKATSPAIKQIDYDMQTRTMPRINSELSKRGVSRSAGAGLSTDIIGQAQRQSNLDIENLISKFQVLNEEQKKQDITEGIGLGQNLNNQEAGMLTNQANADASRRYAQTGIDIGQADKENTPSPLVSGGIGALLNVVAPGSGTLASSFLNSSQKNNYQDVSSIPSLAQYMRDPTTANILKGSKSDEVFQLIMERLQGGI